MRGVGAMRLVGAMAAGGAAIAIGPFFSAIGAPGTTGVGPNIQLSFAGQKVGAVKSISGGGTDMVGPANASDYVGMNKPVGAKVFKPFVIQTAAGMSKGFYSTLAGSLDGNAQRVDGAFTAYDASMTALYEIDFLQAVVREVDFPALDATSSNPTFLSVRLTPEMVVQKSGTGVGQGFVASSNQKQFEAKNFRLLIDGVSCQRVVKVSSISTASASSFTVEFPAADRASFDGWLKASAAIQRSIDTTKTSSAKNGELLYLGPDLSAVLLDLKLTGLHVTNVSPVGSDPTATATISLQHVSMAGGSVLN